MPDTSAHAALPRLGAAAAFIYVVVQLLQGWILAELPAVTTPLERAMLRLDPLNLGRLWSVFLSFFLLPFFVLAVVGRIQNERRPLASAGAVFFLIFIAVELLYRSIELIAVVERSTWNVGVAVVFLVNAARLLFRLLEGYGGATWLQPLNGAIYTPAVSLFFLVVALWLWRTPQPTPRA